MVLATTCRPDISFSVSLLARYSTDPTMRHWQGGKAILRYLKETINYGIFFEKRRDFSIAGFADAGYLSDMTRGKSQTGYLFTAMGSAVAWKSTKQSTAAPSTSHAEIIALYEATKECVWIKRFMTTLHETCRLDFNPSPITIYEDNSAVVYQVKAGLIKNDITKHLNPKFFWMADLDGIDIDVTRIKSQDNVADILTKTMGTTLLQRHCLKMGLLSLDSLTNVND